MTHSTSLSVIIPLFVIIPLAGAFLTSLAGKKSDATADLLGGVSTLGLLVASVFSVFMAKSHGLLVYKVGNWIPPIGIAMVIDGLSAFMLVTTNLVAFLVAVYSVNYMNAYTDKWKFYTLYLLMLAGMNGVIIAGDMFNLYVFLEIASIASYALVAFGTEHEELEASFKYMVMGILASTFILLGIVLLYSLTSTLNMADIARQLSNVRKGEITLLISALFITGFGLKAALVPFHWWLPDAHPSAPAPISAMLSGVLIKVIGIYALIRILFNVVGLSTEVVKILLALGALSMTAGAFLAIGQSDIKRMLAYSSVSQIGYIIIGIGIGTPLAILGALFHLFNHAIFKSLLFLNSGAIEHSTGTRDLNQMGGLSSKMPVTGTTSLIASMSIAGMPPLSGFFSKLIIIFAAIQSGHFKLGVIAAAVSILTLAYYAKLQRLAFFGELAERWRHIKEAPNLMKISMILLALICIFGSIVLIPAVKEIFLKQAADALIIGREYAELVFGSIK